MFAHHPRDLIEIGPRPAMSIPMHVRDNRTDIPLDGPELYTECRDCGHGFHVDTSPDLDLCWLCSEHRAEGADW